MIWVQPHQPEDRQSDALLSEDAEQDVEENSRQTDTKRQNSINSKYVS